MATAVDESTLAARIDATAAFVGLADRLFSVGEIKWADVDADYRRIAVNAALRRQLESLEATVLLCRSRLGHLAVGFVRAALEDVLYLAFFNSLELEKSQELFVVLANWDAFRTLIAQRAYIGDEAMREMWWPQNFLDALPQRREQVRSKLQAVQKEYKWSGGLLPSGDWIADRVGKRDLYDYLHAASSRALHFSAGEILRRGWGDPNGVMRTDSQQFREHLSAFALDQLFRLFIETWGVTMPVLEKAGVSTEEGLEFDKDLRPVLRRLGGLGRVPLVHAAEFNLRPDGWLPGMALSEPESNT